MFWVGVVEVVVVGCGVELDVVLWGGLYFLGVELGGGVL